MNENGIENDNPKPHLTTGPVDIGNREYLNLRLPELKEKYAYEELSRLSEERLKQEEKNLIRDFTFLGNRFPHSDYIGNDDKGLQRHQMEDDYRGLSTLTTEQMQRIVNCKEECYLNLDRAITEAIEREETTRPLARFGGWLNNFVDKLTPLFIIRR